jgi:Flp pilus assembly protein CpaB
MKLIIIVIALVIALVVAFGVSSILTEDKKPAEGKVLASAPTNTETKVERVNIYVAQRDIPIGSVISATDYDIKPWPQHLLPPGAMIYGGGDEQKIDGMITRTPIVKDEPLLASKLRNPNDPSYIAGQLGEGMRAITVPANLTSSVAGFIAPGDKVDVLFTFELIKSAIQGSDISSTKSSGDDRNIAFSEILLPNVMVLAVDARVTDGPAPGQKEGERPPVPTSVTLAVNQRDAQKLKLAQKMGELTMVLRSVKDKDSYDIIRPTAEQDLTRIMPPAYFPVLFDSDAAYDFGVVDLYGSTLSEAAQRGAGVITIDPLTGKLKRKNGESGLPLNGKEPEMAKENPRLSVNVYRGVQLEKVEVNKP